jgi:hypothetical protein
VLSYFFNIAGLIFWLHKQFLVAVVSVLVWRILNNKKMHGTCVKIKLKLFCYNIQHLTNSCDSVKFKYACDICGFVVVTMKIMVFCVVTSILVCYYQRFGETCCIHRIGSLRMIVRSFSEILVSIY